MHALLLITALCFAGVADEPADQTPPAADEGKRTVVWLSIDGIRPDYVGRGNTPTLDRLMREGAYSSEFIPVFPSLTFPSHVSKATGVKVAKHGIPGNSFISNTDYRTHRYPGEARLLEAEPIWNTATRQGLRVLVHDWPLSHSQRGEHATAYHGQRYIGSLSDEQRLTLLVNTWAQDNSERGEKEPLRLLMGYAVGPDSLGHRHGPNADEPVEKLEEVDDLLRAFLQRAFDLWNETRGPNDEFVFILTTDHGMSEVHSLVNINNLAQVADEPSVETVTSGNVGHIFIKAEDDMRRRAVQNILRRIRPHGFAKAYARENLPSQWQFNHPERVGDVVVVLDTGYTFSSRPRDITGPTEQLGGPLGMHGYDPRTNTEMLGVTIMWRFPNHIGGRNLGQVHSLQMHATVANLLGIEPAEDARKDAITLPDQAQRQQRPQRTR
jgi:predicted AlkP superfamily pyrophosphatase or phosphodiesterase